MTCSWSSPERSRVERPRGSGMVKPSLAFGLACLGLIGCSQTGGQSDQIALAPQHASRNSGKRDATGTSASTPVEPKQAQTRAQTISPKSPEPDHSAKDFPLFKWAKTREAGLVRAMKS